MFSQSRDPDFDSDPYMTTAVDALTAALKSGMAGRLNFAATELADPSTVLGRIRGFDSESISGLRVPEVPLSRVIEGYGSSESKQRLANAVGRILNDDMALVVSSLHEWSTFSDAARMIARQLRVAPPAYRCTGRSKHKFPNPGNGLCIFDGSPLEPA